MQLQIAPSILSADFAELGKDIKMLNECADLIHLDVMDGTFVPNISFGFPIIEAVSKIASIPMDAHLMVVHPERWVKRCAELGVAMMSFHQEAAREESGRILDEIKANGMKAGLVINPGYAELALTAAQIEELDKAAKEPLKVFIPQRQKDAPGSDGASRPE